MIELPDAYWDVRYVGARYPGAPVVRERPGLAEGANCQLFAFEVLRHFGLNPPELRSSELWTDTSATQRVTVPRPLDLVLVNTTRDPWGAHIGVWAGDDQVLHLCAEVGRPTLWNLATFAARPSYRTLVGFKRVTTQTPT
ncbi:hydrolase [Actinophytocola sp.]|uniref:hydrolase n=1 Tax=Actinophytocola sp. TaxID=1872138 RepID=UPI002D37B63A|nr:hydrolase [Actinophytocola sp.]HYQ64944.1 hydrolase [Actinophytocola sp.]